MPCRRAIKNKRIGILKSDVTVLDRINSVLNAIERDGICKSVSHNKLTLG